MKKEDLDNLNAYKKKENEIIVGKVYRITRQMGIGTFSDIYEGENIESLLPVSIKLEMKNTLDLRLRQESKYYSQLQEALGIPKMFWYGADGEYNVLVTELLGPNLESLFNFCERNFLIKTVLLIADQMIQRIEHLHNRGIIHRDVKPENFCIGHGQRASQIYIIDYGISKFFFDQVTGIHISKAKDKSLTGNARYASLNSHLGIEMSRRDDLESIGYILLYFLKKKLPWQGLHAQSLFEKYEKIKNIKMNTQIDVLCQGQPNEFFDYIDYVKKLQFEEKPDYNHLRQMFRQLYFLQENWDNCNFEWVEKNKIKSIDQKNKANKKNQLEIKIQEDKDLEESSRW